MAGLDLQGRQYPQPREGIEGKEYGEDSLLALGESDWPRRKMMIELAYHVYSASLNLTESGSQRTTRLRNPVVGDLVVEITSVYRRPTEHSFGYLLAHREEWSSTDAEWEKWLEDNPDELETEEVNRCHDDVWYVQYGPAPDDIVRWANCEFIAVPTDLRFFK